MGGRADGMIQRQIGHHMGNAACLCPARRHRYRPVDCFVAYENHSRVRFEPRQRQFECAARFGQLILLVPHRNTDTAYRVSWHIANELVQFREPHKRRLADQELHCSADLRADPLAGRRTAVPFIDLPMSQNSCSILARNRLPVKRM